MNEPWNDFSSSAVAEPEDGPWTQFKQDDSPPWEAFQLDAPKAENQVSQAALPGINPEVSQPIYGTRTTGGNPRVPLASFAETMVAPVEQFGESLVHEGIPVPKITVNKDDSAVLAVGKEAANIALSIPEFFTSSLGIGSVGAGAVAPAATAGAFTVDLLHSLGKQIKDTYQNWSGMSTAEKSVALTDIAGTGAFAALTGHATIEGAKTNLGLREVPKIENQPQTGQTIDRMGQSQAIAPDRASQFQALQEAASKPDSSPEIKAQAAAAAEANKQPAIAEQMRRDLGLPEKPTEPVVPAVESPVTEAVAKLSEKNEMVKEPWQMTRKEWLDKYQNSDESSVPSRESEDLSQHVQDENGTKVWDNNYVTSKNPDVKFINDTVSIRGPKTQETSNGAVFTIGNRYSLHEFKYKLDQHGLMNERLSSLYDEVAKVTGGKIGAIPILIVRNAESRGRLMGGQFNPYTGTIDVSTISLSSKNKLQRTILHEAIHAVTHDAIENRLFFKDAKDAQRVQFATDQLKALFNEARKLDNTEGTQNWRKNIHEFVAEAFTNKSFQRWLSEQTTSVGGKATYFERFISIVKKVLGIDPSKMSMLDDIIHHGADLIEAQSSGTKYPQRESGYNSFLPADENFLENRHREHVKRAIAEGKIKSHPDYPDLQQKLSEIDQKPAATTVGQQVSQAFAALSEQAKNRFRERIVRNLAEGNESELTWKNPLAIEMARNDPTLILRDNSDGSVTVTGIKPTPVTPATEEPAIATNAPTELSTGPGAATPVDVAAYDPASQLTDALKTVKETDPLRRSQLYERVADTLSAGKDSLTRAWDKSVAVKDAIKSNLTTLPEVTPLKRLVAALDFQIQSSSARSRELGRALERSHPNKSSRSAMAVLIDSGMDVEKVKAAIAQLPEKTSRSVRRAFESAASLTPKELETASRIKDYFGQRLEDAQQAGVLNKFLEDYYTHVWKDPKKMPAELRGAISNGRVVTYFENARHRTLETFIEGVKAGLEPVLDPALILPKYNFNLDRAIASRSFIKELTKTKEADGRPTAAPSGSAIVIKDDAGETTSTLIKPGVKSDATGDYKTPDNPALKKWKWVQTDEQGKPVLVQGDLAIHPDAYNRVMHMMDRNRLSPTALMRVGLAVSAEVKGAKLGVLSPFHQIHVGSHALWHLVNPFSMKPEIDWTHPSTKFAVESGLKLSADFHDQSAFSEGLGPGLIAQKLVPYSRVYSEYLFESFIPRLKLKTFEAVYQRELKRNDKRENKISDEQVRARAADAVNNGYGELNRLWLGKDGRDPRLQRGMRLFLLAPDFLEARARFVGKVFNKLGNEERMAAFVMVSTLYVAARVLNQLLDGNPHADDPKMAFSVRHNGKNYSVRSVAGDAIHFATDFRSFASTRINPVTARTVVEFISGRDVRTGLKRDAEGQLADLLKQISPAQVDSMLPGDREWYEGLVQSLGVTSRHQMTPEEQKRMDERKKKEADNPAPFEFIYNPAHRNVKRPAKP